MISESIARTLASEAGESLFRFLREVFYIEKAKGSFLLDPDHKGYSQMVHQALDMSLLEETGPGCLKLTPIGYEVANFAKEYCNWIDEGRSLPLGMMPSMLNGKRLLDVGCSFGRHLASFSKRGTIGYGIDLQEDYLLLSRVFAQREGIKSPHIARADAIQLPFRSGEFDIVFCNLVLNYVHCVDSAISEFARVLKPGGQLVLGVETFRRIIKSLLHDQWIGNFRQIAFKLYGIMNTLVLETTGRQIKIKVQGRMHAVHSPTWPSGRWIQKKLLRHGFLPAEGKSFRDKDNAGLFKAVLRFDTLG